MSFDGFIHNPIINFQNITVKCPSDGNARKIQLRYATDSKGSYDISTGDIVYGKVIYAPSNGCDFLNGSAACGDCLAAIDRRILVGGLTKPVHFDSGFLIK